MSEKISDIENFFELKKYLHERFCVLEDYTPNEEIEFVSRALNLRKETLLINSRLSKAQIKKVLKLSKRRINGEPITKIFHSANFYYDEFYINKFVLSPRKETELLVEKVLEYIKSQQKTDLKVLDLCCGSGVIGLTIAKYSRDYVKVLLSDVSRKALKVARKNRKKLEIEAKTRLVHSNMFSNLKKGILFDIIVCNPPYIETNLIENLSNSVKGFDPKIALDGGEDGLKFYKQIAKEAKEFLFPDGKIFLEIGYNQKEAVTKIFSENGFVVKGFKDYSQNDRIIIASRE